MGFIDTTMMPRDSDLYRFADPNDNVRRLAVEDMKATAVNAAQATAQANPQSAIGNRQSGVPQVPQRRRILSSQEWVQQNYPEVTRQRFLSPAKRKHIMEGYKLYLTVQEMSMRERMAEFNAKIQAARLGQERTGGAAAKQPTMPGNIAGQMGYAHLTDVSPEKIRALQAVLDRVYPQQTVGAGQPAAGAQAAEDMWPKSYYAEKLAGPASVDPLMAQAGVSDQGLLGSMRQGPLQWLSAYREIEAMIPFNSDRTNQGLAQALNLSKPTMQDVQASLQGGEITAQQANDILEIILTPEELQAHQARQKAIETAPRPSWFQRTFGRPRIGSGAGRTTPY